MSPELETNFCFKSLKSIIFKTTESSSCKSSRKLITQELVTGTLPVFPSVLDLDYGINEIYRLQRIWRTSRAVTHSLKSTGSKPPGFTYCSRPSLEHSLSQEYRAGVRFRRKVAGAGWRARVDLSQGGLVSR